LILKTTPVVTTGINVAGYIRSEMGIGEAARSHIAALEAAGCPVSIIDVSHTTAHRNRDTSVLASAGSGHQINLVCVNACNVPAFAAQVGLTFFKKRYNIGSWWWELPDLPKAWHNAFRFFDEIWVGTTYVQQALSKVSSIPCVRIPPVVNTGLIPATTKSHFGLPDDEFTILFVYDYSSVFQRKNPLAAIGAFKKAFQGNERVRLVLKSINAKHDSKSHRQLLDASDDPRISIFAEHLSRLEKNRLIAACDVYLSLHRAEGFGLTLAEAMSMGKPVVGTAWSGNTDYMNEANSFPVQYRLTTLEKDYRPYAAGQTWAEPDVEHAANILKRLFNEPSLGRERGRQAAVDIRTHFSADTVSRHILERLKIIEPAVTRRLKGDDRWLDQVHEAAVQPRTVGPQASSFLSLPIRVARRFRNSVFKPSAPREIEASRLFDREWYLEQNPDVNAAGMDPILHYIEFGATEGRDPSPSFSTYTYLLANPDVLAAGVNPLLHFILDGAKEGRVGADGEWGPFGPLESRLSTRLESESLELDCAVAVPFAYRPFMSAPAPHVAAICHIFHDQVAPEFRRYLQNAPFPLDVFITTDTPSKQAAIGYCFADWNVGAVEIRLAMNRGRDIAPKLIAVRDVYARYDYVLHIHSKRSVYPELVKSHWRRFLLENLLGSPEVVGSIFDAFARYPDLGILAPQHFEPIRRDVHWGGNFGLAESLASRMGIPLSEDGRLDYPSGSMFWARSAALKPLLDLNLAFEDFPVEPNDGDATANGRAPRAESVIFAPLAHAIECLYFFACERAGFRWIKVARPELFHHTPGIVPIDSPDTLDRFMAEKTVRLIG